MQSWGGGVINAASRGLHNHLGGQERHDHSVVAVVEADREVFSCSKGNLREAQVAGGRNNIDFSLIIMANVRSLVENVNTGSINWNNVLLESYVAYNAQFYLRNKDRWLRTQP